MQKFWKIEDSKANIPMQKFWKIEDSKANKRRKKFKQGKQNLYRIACEMGWSNCKYQDLTILYWSKINNFFVCKMKLLFILKKYLLFTILSFLMKSGNALFKIIYKYTSKNRPKHSLFLKHAVEPVFWKNEHRRINSVN